MWASRRLLSSASHQINTPTFPSGMWRKFEKEHCELAFSDLHVSQSRWLSIARFFQPFDILLDVAVCVTEVPQWHFIVHYFRERKRGMTLERIRGPVGLLIEFVGLTCRQTPTRTPLQCSMPAIKQKTIYNNEYTCIYEAQLGGSCTCTVSLWPWFFYLLSLCSCLRSKLRFDPCFYHHIVWVSNDRPCKSPWHPPPLTLLFWCLVLS